MKVSFASNRVLSALTLGASLLLVAGCGNRKTQQQPPPPSVTVAPVEVPASRPTLYGVVLVHVTFTLEVLLFTVPL